MDPIINPWWIYLAEKSGSVGEACIIIGILASVASLFWSILYLVEELEIKPKKWLIIIGIVGILIGTLLPNQKTVYTMMTLKYVTPNNIETVGNTLKDTVDYIIEKIEDITDEKDN